MSALILWVKQIVIFSIISNVILQVIPGSKYDKYVKLFTGLIMMIITINPMLNLLHMDGIINDFYQSYHASQKISDMKMQLKYAENSSYEGVIQPYRQEMVEAIESIILENNLYPISTNILIDTNSESSTFGQILKINMEVSKKYKDENKVVIEKINIDLKSNTDESSMGINEVNIVDRVSSYFGVSKEIVNIVTKT